MDHLNSCKELYRLLSNSFGDNACRLTFAPDQPDIDTGFFLSDDGNSVEIVCFKSTYLLIFKEAHNYFNQFQRLSACPKNWETYYSSLGFLLTTPENKTNFNVHFDTLLNLFKENEVRGLLVKELKIVQRLLTSSNNRLNKSSSLWQLYRKLYTLSFGWDIGDNHDYLSTFSDSGIRHFSNYYSWNTAKWYFDIVSTSEKLAIVEQTKKYCFRNFKDTSSWNALTYMVCQSKNKFNYNIKEYYRLQKMLNLSSKYRDENWLQCNVEEIFKEIIKLIDSFSVEEWSPFLCCLAIAFTFSDLDTKTLTTRWRTDVETFEDKHGVALTIRNNPVVSQECARNLLLRVGYRHIGYKKRFIVTYMSNTTI
ncbi:ZYBA0S05-06238g1_1 [Zygosaccharomyces bailii CLIB 213]|uniref:ZYBA0S05-06238g1_1 n=1 Tax=Zygosaccharomyces bailii (strain CLIB 213 / ATCC 58445 / CBS 680 / BCRC 21525 / NBRC 1098 / NCYC 1416 / NRRL Y-2227) TaxID=1333698 RepID=A0A8J2X8M0_ZYGB2|nr:ZYBA0S05-06238g1_1 [Zygosaccharomyces bailii CLIB 213]